MTQVAHSQTQMSPGNESRAPRFLFLSSDKYPPFRVDVDVLFAKELKSRNYEIDWLMQLDEASDESVTEEALARKEINWRGWRVFVGPTDTGQSLANRLRKHWLNFRNDTRVLNMAKRGNYDFIQVKDKFLGALLAILAAKRAQCDFVYWLSWPFPEASLYASKIGTARYPALYWLRGKFFGWVLYKVIAPRARHIFVQSEQMKRDMVSKGVSPGKMTAVPMGFEPTDEVHIEEQVNPLEILYLGTLLKTRRLDFLVRVLHEVRKEIPEATLTLVGPEELPGDFAEIEAAASALGLTKAVTLTGRLPRAEAFARVRKAGVCVSPFFPTPILNSTSPTKLVEYFSQKKATVANDHPEQREVLEASGGGICTPYDERAFATAISKILSDPELAKSMGEAGYKFAMANRTYEAIAEEVDRTYQSICFE